MLVQRKEAERGEGPMAGCEVHKHDAQKQRLNLILVRNLSADSIVEANLPRKESVSYFVVL